MCETCEMSRRANPEARARFEADAPRLAALWGVPVGQVLCAGFADDLTWSRLAGLGDNRKQPGGLWLDQIQHELAPAACVECGNPVLPRLIALTGPRSEIGRD
jgi:hypothetical protein